MPGSRPQRVGTARPRAIIASELADRSGNAPKGDPFDFMVVGVGASAGGLDACRQLVAALPTGNGMAFILIQHLDPTHDSMMVDLLAGYTSMTVRHVTDGMPIVSTRSRSSRPRRNGPIFSEGSSTHTS